MIETPRLLAGRYEIGELIGRGGMADVYSGYDARLGREVAIKILRSELARDNTFLLRFRREAKAAASLSHPSIVAVFDSGEDGDDSDPGSTMPFIVMEYVHGRTLRDILHEDGPLEPLRAARIMAQVVRALNYSHDHGIVHRDIKPANVMVTDGDQAKVMDFGIARAIADTAATMTNTSIVVGTAQYLSPEQAQGRDVDARSDLYSAGCLLYELLTGRPPFVGDSPVAIAYQHVGEPPQPPSVHHPEVPSNLDVVVLHALAKDPEQRYDSGDEFAADLDAVMRREPTKAAAAAVAAGELAPPAPVVAAGAAGGGGATAMTMGPPPRHDPRRRTAIIAAVVALALLAAGILGLLYQRGAFEDNAPVAVPDVTQQSESQAKSIITAAGLNPVTTPVSDLAAKGTVVTQQPGGGKMAMPGSNVQLSVSSGPGEVTVPNLRNYQPDIANQRLRDAGLSVGGVRQVDTYEVAAGSVVATAPKALSKVRQGTAVTLIISTGQVVVPDVTGQSQDDAVTALTKIGLKVHPEAVESPKRAGTVVGQSYPKDSKVPVGTEITLNIAKQVAPAPTVTVTSSPTPSTPPTRPSTPPSTSPTSTAPPTPSPSDTHISD